MFRTALLFLILCLSEPINVLGQIQQELKGTIVRIIDGDTMVLLDSLKKQHRIRLYGIDCPENGQDFAQVAKRYTSSLTFQKEVIAHVLYRDRYKRAVAKVFSDDVEVNLALLEEGLAWHHLAYDQSDLYAKAQKKAQKRKRGLWIQIKPTAPWEYRKIGRK